MLRKEADGRVLRLTLDRPEVRNAFNDELIAALTEAFANLDGARVVVLRGEGKAFSAGGDLNWMARAAAFTEEENFEDALRLAELFEAMIASPAVIIAQVHGAAFGGGCGLAAAADVCIASEGTLFAFSEVRLGLVPATISRIVLPKIGAGHARALFSTGKAFDAAHALRIGLVHEMAAEAELEAAAESWIEAALAAGPQASAESKRIAVEGPFGVEEGARLLARARSGEEGRAGVAAFLAKEPAPWR
jgi:enoyl-CoA hydratase/carnithine racemase